MQALALHVAANLTNFFSPIIKNIKYVYVNIGRIAHNAR